MRPPFKTALLLALLLCAGVPAARAVVGVPTVITFAGLAPGPVNGLNILGVTFNFQIGGLASTDATVGISVGPGATPLISPPILEGNTLGILMLDFATPIAFLQFGSHLSSETNVMAALGVQLYDTSMTPIGGLMNLDMTLSPDYAGGIFEYTGSAASHAMIQFNSQAAGRFAIDNLVFVPVPEPNVAWLALPALLGGLAYQRRVRNSTKL